MTIKAVLNSPAIYQRFQELGGFFGARLKALQEVLPLSPGQKIIDIGCGPGYIVARLPKGISYTGFDIDPGYIQHATKAFGNIGDFHCRLFDRKAADEFAGADVVMMNGVMHHIPDVPLVETLASIRRALKPGGALFTLDGVFEDGQSTLAAWLIKNDRGKYVRTKEGYEVLLRTSFESVSGRVFNRLSWIPYTYFVSVCR